MRSRLRILHLEDSPHDAELIQATLLAEGIESDIVRVETREDFAAALDAGEFDLVFADYALPRFDGMAALNLAQARRPKTPFLFVTGTMGEELAVDALHHGARDFVVKSRLGKLGPAVRRALAEVESGRERRRAEERLVASYAELRRTLTETVAALGHAVEVRDPYTAGHQSRVAELACAIARRMNGRSEEDLAGIRIAGMLHDIGKLHIPAEILSKPARLSPQEFELIKTHAIVGGDIVGKISFPWPVAAVAGQHHERLDGTGYPCGLQGDAIHPAARIMAVADVVEAMCSHRPYRPALPRAAAVDEIQKGKGGRYDPAVADAFLQLAAEGAVRL